MGADHLVNVRKENAVQRMRELTGGIGVDLCLVTSGSQDSFQQALEGTRRGGVIVLIAHFDDPVMVEIGLAVQKDIVIYTVRGEGWRSVHRALEVFTSRTDGALKAGLAPVGQGGMLSGPEWDRGR